jgi:hypothetical protein
MSNNLSSETFAGSWIVDAGPGQIKTVTVYTPAGDGKFSAVESVFNFDWTLGGQKPEAVGATSLIGAIEADGQEAAFSMVAYALDAHQKAVYILKAVGNKVLVDRDTISVENLVFHFYNNPETANPVVDAPDFCIPSTGTFPPVREYRIKLSR